VRPFSKRKILRPVPQGEGPFCGGASEGEDVGLPGGVSSVKGLRPGISSLSGGGRQSEFIPIVIPGNHENSATRKKKDCRRKRSMERSLLLSECSLYVK